MYFEVYALPSTSAAATEVHITKDSSPTKVLSADDTVADSSKKDVPTKRGVVSGVADEDPTREGRCGGDPIRRFNGGDVGLKGFALERILHFDASADR